MECCIVILCQDELAAIQIIIYCDFQFKYRFQNKICDQISKNVKWILIKWKLVQIRIYLQKWKLENKTEKKIVKS